MGESETLIVSLDVGTSSVRSGLFNQLGAAKAGFGEQLTYQIATTPDGGVEADPKLLFDLCRGVLTTVHGHMRDAGLKPAAIAFDAFWHSFLGVDAAGELTTPIVHLFDTRSTEQVKELSRMLDPVAVHQRTGCLLHTSYWPAKLLWLYCHRHEQFDRTARWMSFGEFLFLRLFGNAIASTSMVSGSGLWNQALNRYDDEVLSKLPVRAGQLCAVDALDAPQLKLLSPYKEEWPLFDGVPWFPALGDGACNNIGSGCATPGAFSLMVGTSGAMRAVLAKERVDIPAGLWCYRVDRARFVLGGALSNGGEVYAWMRRTLALPSEDDTEEMLLNAKPGSHNLLLLPFFAGERSPYWRADLRAAITGMNLATTAMDIVQAALESVALRFREIFELMQSSLGVPHTVIASGGGLLHSPAWTQMMADALGVPVVPCLESEATSRGAALLAAERIGAIAKVADVGVSTGGTVFPRDHYTEIYATMLREQNKLYKRLFTEAN